MTIAGVDGLPRVRGRTVVLTALLMAVAAVLFAVAAALIDRWLSGSARLAIMLFFGVIGMGLPLLLVGRRLGWGWADWGFRRPRRSLWHVLWLVPLAIVSSLTVTGVVLTALGVDPAGASAASDEAFRGGSPVMMLLVAVTAIVLAPLIEEMLFRRLLLDWLRQRAPVVVAVLGCSLIFAAVHLLPPAMLYVGLVGLWMAILRVWSGALWHSVILHAVNNSIATLVVIMALS